MRRQDLNDIGHAGDGGARRVVDEVIAIRVHRLCVEALLALLLALLDVLADPYVAVEAENEVDAAGEGEEVRFEAADKEGRDGDELAVAELAVLEGARVEGRFSRYDYREGLMCSRT